ncbi:hypothetical protein [Hymenobacter canadensis]|uniref:MarR family transcriptional regulator n=1 Tax=Hymenobacter canadensis TaxID=2999067 RepID=A0ABY7LUH7_9BACT|nr:hypothetical protein [Hymenobacter canadensis]WBA44045.1 hypothetical protein O3303_21015 [Hymenobacter canadensis]
MRKFNGLRPQDIVLLLKLVASSKARVWLGKELAYELSLSASEVSEALARCRYSRLLAPDPGSHQVQARALIEFLLHGLPYVFAAHAGAQARGIQTASSAAPLNKTFGTEPAYVWPNAAGEAWGAAIEPLYPGVAAAAQKDARLYELLALVDALRLGRPRERRVAAQLIEAAITQHVSAANGN